MADRNIKKISIIGSGIVGSATGKGLHKLGHDVLFYDICYQKLQKLGEQGYVTCSSIEYAISCTNISFVCVNTPTTNGKQDLSQLIYALSEIAKALIKRSTNKDNFHLCVIRSTILPGTMKNVVLDYLDKKCIALNRGKDYDICYNPEFLRQDTALHDFLNPHRIVIGEDTKGASFSLTSIYGLLTDNLIITDYDTAEMIKYVSNCFLSLKISFFNEIGVICKQLGIDDKIVSLAVSLDKRIGKYGTESGKPFDGLCLPKDTEAMANFVKRLRIKTDLIRTALEINKKIEEQQQSSIEVSKVRNAAAITDSMATTLYQKGNKF